MVGKAVSFYLHFLVMPNRHTFVIYTDLNFVSNEEATLQKRDKKVNRLISLELKNNFYYTLDQLFNILDKTVLF
jgi:hypothetical protein